MSRTQFLNSSAYVNDYQSTARVSIIPSVAAKTATATLTTTELLNGLITVFAAANTVLTTPTAAAMVRAIPNCTVGSTVRCHVLLVGPTHAGVQSYANVTLTAGTGVTLANHPDGTSQDIDSGGYAELWFRVTSVDATTPTVTMYIFNSTL